MHHCSCARTTLAVFVQTIAGVAISHATAATRTALPRGLRGVAIGLSQAQRRRYSEPAVSASDHFNQTLYPSEIITSTPSKRDRTSKRADSRLHPRILDARVTDTTAESKSGKDPKRRVGKKARWRDRDSSVASVDELQSRPASSREVRSRPSEREVRSRTTGRDTGLRTTGRASRSRTTDREVKSGASGRETYSKWTSAEDKDTSAAASRAKPKKYVDEEDQMIQKLLEDADERENPRPRVRRTSDTDAMSERTAFSRRSERSSAKTSSAFTRSGRRAATRTAKDDRPKTKEQISKAKTANAQKLVQLGNEVKKAMPNWMVQKNALKEKFGGAAWNPRKRVSPDTLNGIRALHDADPKTYSTPVLAEHLRISKEALRRILKSKWRPSEKEIEDRRVRWEKRGERSRAGIEVNKEKRRLARKIQAVRREEAVARVKAEFARKYAEEQKAKSTF